SRQLVPLSPQLLNPLLQSGFEAVAGRFVWLRLWELTRQHALQLLPDALLALEQLAELPVCVQVEQAVAGPFAVGAESARHFAATDTPHPACRRLAKFAERQLRERRLVPLRSHSLKQPVPRVPDLLVVVVPDRDGAIRLARIGDEQVVGRDPQHLLALPGP